MKRPEQPRRSPNGQDNTAFFYHGDTEHTEIK